MLMNDKDFKSLIDVSGDFINNGIFKYLETYAPVWSGEIDSDVLNLDYYGNRSGRKSISKMLECVLNGAETLSNTQLQQIAKLIYQKFGYSWSKAYEALHTEYEPLENYNKVVNENITNEGTDNNTETRELVTKHTGTVDVSGTETGTDAYKKSGTDTRTETLNTTDTMQSTTNTETTNTIYGFDSVEGSRKDKSNGNSQENGSNSTTGTNTTSDEYGSTTTETKDLKNSNKTTNDLSDTDTGTVKNDKTTNLTTNRDYHESGNIGVTTSQQMLESELQLRFNNIFFDMVFKDVDSVMVSNVYDIWRC